MSKLGDKDYEKYVEELVRNNMNMKTSIEEGQEIIIELQKRIDKAIEFIDNWKNNRSSLKASILELLYIKDLLEGIDEVPYEAD